MLKKSLLAAAAVLAAAGASAADLMQSMQGIAGPGAFKGIAGAKNSKTYRSRGKAYPFSSTRQDDRQRRQHGRNTAKLAKREARAEAELAQLRHMFGTITGRMVYPYSPDLHEMQRQGFRISA